MRIVHYIPSVDESSGGVGAYMQLLSRELGKQCELHVITHKGENERTLENCTIHYLPYKWLPWNNCKSEFLKLLNDIKPEVFHTNCCWMPLSALMAIWAHKAGFRTVYTPHGMLEPYSFTRSYWTKKLPAVWLFQRLGVAVCDVVHATAESERKNLLDLGWNRNVKDIPNCVRLDEINCKYDVQSVDVPHNTTGRKILFLSRVHPKKGIELLIEAAANLRDELSDYRIIIGGDGAPVYINSLKDMVSQKSLDHVFSFIGPVYGDAKWRLYREADLFVLPTYSENFGIVVAEALASGVPVITTKGTPWQELETRNCGWWVDTTSEAIVGALRKFLATSDDVLKQMGLNGRRLVEEKYDSRAVARLFIDLYKSLR